MSLFLHNLHTEAQKHAAALIAVGFAQAEIDAIQTLANQLYTKDTDQETFDTLTPEATAARDAVHNATWAFVQKTNKLSKVIYRTNITKLNQFLLPRNSESADAFNLIGQVTDSATGLPVSEVLANLMPNNISRDTDDNGDFGFGSLPAGTYTLRVSKAGYATQNISVTIISGQTTTINVVLVAA